MNILAIISCNSGSLELANRPRCNQTLASLKHLQEASLDVITRSNDYVLCVDLLGPSTLEYIGYATTDIEYASVIISGNDSVVRCEPPTTELPLNDYTQFPLTFSNSSLVAIEGVRFESCLRPLQFKWVTRVELTSSSFR